jgi:hypothetical protein
MSCEKNKNMDTCSEKLKADKNALEFSKLEMLNKKLAQKNSPGASAET